MCTDTKLFILLQVLVRICYCDDTIDDLIAESAQPRGVMIEAPLDIITKLPLNLKLSSRYKKVVVTPSSVNDKIPYVDVEDYEDTDTKTLSNFNSYDNYYDNEDPYEYEDSTKKPYRKFQHTEQIDYFLDHNSPVGQKQNTVQFKKQRTFPKSDENVSIDKSEENSKEKNYFLKKEDTSSEDKSTTIVNSRENIGNIANYVNILANINKNNSTINNLDKEIDIGNLTKNIQEKLKPFIKDNVGPIQKIPRKSLDAAASGSSPIYLATNNNHKQKSKKPSVHSEKHSSGGGKEHHSGHHSEGGKKGDKGYKGEHKDEHFKKGQHVKKADKGKHEENKGHKAKHHHDDGEHKDYHKEEKGEKGDSYKEDANYKDGHTTKGEHNIHKKDEYEKKVEFFDEFYDSGEYDKHGHYSHKKDYEKGGHKKGGHKKHSDHEDHYDKEETSEKKHHYSDNKGHDVKKGGHDHHDHYDKYSKKNAHKGGKKWAYKQ